MFEKLCSAREKKPTQFLAAKDFGPYYGFNQVVYAPVVNLYVLPISLVQGGIGPGGERQEEGHVRIVKLGKLKGGPEVFRRFVRSPDHKGGLGYDVRPVDDLKGPFESSTRMFFRYSSIRFGGEQTRFLRQCLGGDGDRAIQSGGDQAIGAVEKDRPGGIWDLFTKNFYAP